ncbi:hypothetical protein FRB90_010600 [Tulasnella sp. 427]|nr:hypothetical protein FRB90_010600 [Tulasnella sp. 427]
MFAAQSPLKQSDTSSTEQNGKLGIEDMFSQIMNVVTKSVADEGFKPNVWFQSAEIAELRQESNELRLANKDLQQQLKNVMAGSLNLKSPHRQNSSPSAPPSPALGYTVSPFLAPNPTPSFYVPPPIDVSTGKALSHEVPGFWAVVPAGGAGTRLWPLSRKGYPKFFLDLTQSGRSLIQGTWDRLLPLSTPERLMVVTGNDHSQGVKDQLPDLLAGNLLSEPSPKESAAAIGLAAAVLARRDPEAILGSFAADHMISGNEAFLSAVTEAAVTAKQNLLVTIGIAPSHPATGFGYIRLGDRLAIEGAPNACRVSQFKEKPDSRTASAYLSSGNYRWNADALLVTTRARAQEVKKIVGKCKDGGWKQVL